MNESRWTFKPTQTIPGFEITLVGSRTIKCLAFRNWFLEDDTLSAVLTYTKGWFMPNSIDGTKVRLYYYDKEGVKLKETYIGNVDLVNGLPARVQQDLGAFLGSALRQLSRAQIVLAL